MIVAFEIVVFLSGRFQPEARRVAEVPIGKRIVKSKSGDAVKSGRKLSGRHDKGTHALKLPLREW